MGAYVDASMLRCGQVWPYWFTGPNPRLALVEIDWLGEGEVAFSVAHPGNRVPRACENGQSEHLRKPRSTDGFLLRVNAALAMIHDSGTPLGVDVPRPRRSRRARLSAA